MCCEREFFCLNSSFSFTRIRAFFFNIICPQTAPAPTRRAARRRRRAAKSQSHTTERAQLPLITPSRVTAKHSTHVTKSRAAMPFVFPAIGGDRVEGEIGHSKRRGQPGYSQTVPSRDGAALEWMDGSRRAREDEERRPRAGRRGEERVACRRPQRRRPPDQRHRLALAAFPLFRLLPAKTFRIRYACER